MILEGSPQDLTAPRRSPDVCTVLIVYNIVRAAYSMRRVYLYHKNETCVMQVDRLVRGEERGDHRQKEGLFVDAPGFRSYGEICSYLALVGGHTYLNRRVDKARQQLLQMIPSG